MLRTGNQRITLKIQKVQFQKGASDGGSYAVAFATDLAYDKNPASREYELTVKLRLHILECVSKNTDCTISIKANKARKAQIRVHKVYIYSAHVVCQLKLIYTWPSVPYAKSGITSPVNIFLMQIQIVTVNALCVSKDELNLQRYTYMYNNGLVCCMYLL